MNPQRSIRVNGDLNVNVPDGETAAVVANMSARGQQSFANAALRTPLGGNSAASNAGRSYAGNSRAGASRAGTSSIGRDLITGEPGGSRSGMSQRTSGSRAGGFNMAVEFAQDIDRRSGSQRSVSTNYNNNQAGLHGSQQSGSRVGSNRQLVPYVDNQRAPSIAGSQTGRPAVANAAPQAGLNTIVEEGRGVNEVHIHHHMPPVGVYWGGSWGGPRPYRRSYYGGWCW